MNQVYAFYNMDLGTWWHILHSLSSVYGLHPPSSSFCFVAMVCLLVCLLILKWCTFFLLHRPNCLLSKRIQKMESGQNKTKPNKLLFLRSVDISYKQKSNLKITFTHKRLHTWVSCQLPQIGKSLIFHFFLSLGMMDSDWISSVITVMIASVFVAELYQMVFIYHFVSICSSVYRHLGWFHI